MRKIDEAYAFIRDYINEKDYPPTIREIGDAINIRSTSTVAYYLRKLEENNKIVKGSYKNRSIQLTENIASKLDSVGIITMPFIKHLTPNAPLMCERNISNKFMFSGEMFKGLDMFLMPANDNDMEKSAIIKGDMVVVSRQNVARNGEIVVAVVNGEYIIGRLFKQFDVFKIEFDSNKEPIYLEKIIILGKVVGVIRNNIN